MHSAGEHLILGRGVNDAVAVAGADDGKIVGQASRVRKEIGDFDAALPVPGEIVGREPSSRASGWMNW